LIHFICLSYFLSRLNGEESIQMVTALVLQLIQCSIKIPDNDTSSETVETTTEGKDDGEPVKVLTTKVIAAAVLIFHCAVLLK